MTSRQKPISLPGPRWLIGWWKIAYGSALDFFKNFQKLPTNESWYDLELSSEESFDGAEEEKLRCFFDQILYIFLEEICGSGCFGSLPQMLGDGQSLYLFKLYLLAIENEEYETVFKNWVAEVGSSVKLVYAKYFDRLDRWLQIIVKNMDSKGVLQDNGADPSAGLMDSDLEFSGVSSETLDQNKKDGEYPHWDLEKSHLNSTDNKKLCNDNEVQNSVESDQGKKSVENMKNVYEGEHNMISDPTILTEKVSDRKRKRDSHWRMLDWVVGVAKNPVDPEVGSLPERCSWKYYGSEELWKQVLLAREATFLTRNVDISAEQSISNWLKQKMHPSMYDDRAGSERLRCSQRLLSTKESPALPSKIGACSESSTGGTQSDLENHLAKESDSLSADSVFVWLGDNQNRKRVPVGPFFQANVPEWTVETGESDSRWLGSKVWPLECGEHNKYLIERDRIGKGRQGSCGCERPGSVECVRFHVAEKRMRLKLELGLAFQRWKFDKMGEEVALSWTKEDEKRFQEIIRSNPTTLDECCWDEIVKSFPRKRREDLVSYYFNVFLLQRRGHQNRFTPSNIDSDEEESEFGSLSGFRRAAVKSPGSIFHSPKKSHLNSR